MDIIVTTPKSEMANAAKEAQDAISGKVKYYIRAFPKNFPTKLVAGCRVFYVEDGEITGYCIVNKLLKGEMGFRCKTTGREWYGDGIVMRCDSWKWVKPIPMKGFQGFRYRNFPDSAIEVIGDWRDPKPSN